MVCVKTQSSDAEWLKIFNGARWLREKKYLYIFEQVLWHGSSQIVVPASMVGYLLNLFHDSPFAGHRAFGGVRYTLFLVDISG